MTRMRVDREQGATFVELFFDLVFVYAVTQLTSLVLHDLTWAGVGRAALLFWLVWWARTQFTWTLNTADTEHVWVRLPTLAATAVAFFLAQSVPGAFDDAGIWFALSYVIVRIIGLAVQEWVSRDERSDTDGLSIWTRLSAIGLVLVLVGGIVGPELRLWFWGAALVADLAAAARAGQGIWDLVPGHFAERHGLIVIIALGESLIAAGVATAGLPRDGAFALTTIGAVVAACALWWTYFEHVHPALERALLDCPPEKLGGTARDVFSLWHAVIVAGVIGVAVGFEEAVAHPAEPLHLKPALAMTLGVAAFIGGALGALHRAGVRGVSMARPVVVVALVAATPLLPTVPASAAVWLVAVGAVVVAIAEHRRADVDRADATIAPESAR